MRLALVHLRHAGTGGTERYLDQVAAYMAERGHAVTIVCRRHETAPHPGVRFVVLRPLALGAAWRMWSFAAAVERHVRDAAYDLVFGLGKTWSHDVIRLGGGCHQTYLELAHAATLGPWERRIAGGRLKHRLALAIERRALAPGRFVRVVTNSDLVKRDVMARHGVAADRIDVIYNGVDLERFHPRQRAGAGARLRAACGFAAENVVLLFLGTGYGRKGLGALLEAFPQLLRERPNARLLVVGYDSGAGRFEQRARELGVAAATRFLGGRRDAEACYGAADLYVLPTRYDPFANSTLEALASGLPVITTSTNGASELLEEGEHGSVLRDAGNVQDLLRSLRFWTSDQRPPHTAIAARQLAERHPQQRTAAETAEILAGVAASGERTAVRRALQSAQSNVQADTTGHG
jgi:UDP-glucose:(heptosyl)LPS alpha-1,3-glucosyltransferase